MKATGIIRSIDNSIITIEELGDAAICAGCSSGSCSSCGGSSGRTYKAKNSDNLELKENVVVEIDLPAGKAIAALLRVIVMPVFLFFTCYLFIPRLFHSGEGMQIAAGVIGLLVGLGLNLLIPEKIREMEMPVITKIYH